MRGQLVSVMKPLHAFAVENGGAYPGTPDIAYIGGWIECKATDYWPARPGTIVQLDHHLTEAQRVFIVRQAVRGGKSLVMLNIQREWLLLEGMTAVKHLEVDATREMLYDLALGHWKRKPTFEQLRPLL